MGAEAGARRLLRANWLGLAQAAERRGAGDRAAFAGLSAAQVAHLQTSTGTVNSFSYLYNPGV